MEKTIREWFESWDTYGELAIKETITLMGDYRLNSTENSLRDALLGSFVWVESSQGYEFWNDLYDSLP